MNQPFAGRLRSGMISLNSLAMVCLVVGLLAGPLVDSVSGAVPGGQGKKGGGGNKIKQPGGGGGNKGNKVKKDKKPRGGGQGNNSDAKKKEKPKPDQPKDGENKERKGEKPDKGNGGGRGGQKSRSKPAKISARDIGTLASTALAWIQGSSGNASPSVAPFFGTANLKAGGGGDKTTKQNNDSGVDTLAVFNDQQREKLRAILDHQRPLMQQFQAKQAELMSMLDGLRTDEPTSLSKVMPIARELGKLEVNIGMMQAELLAQMQIALDGPELQRMQNIRSAYVNNYPASVTAEERDAAQSYLSSLPRDDQREMAVLASKALAWLTVARQPVDPESGGKKGGKNGGGKGSKNAGYLAVKSGGGGGNKEEAGYGILSQLTTSQVRILTSAAVSQAAYRSAYEERRGWLEQTLLAMKKARLTADMRTIERVASDLGGYSGRIAYSQAKAFQSLSKTLTDEQRKTLLTSRQAAKRK
ncbi:MAG: hypothetical protein ACPGVU_01340 [Limisphaerales bacterium]